MERVIKDGAIYTYCGFDLNRGYTILEFYHFTSSANKENYFKTLKEAMEFLEGQQA